MSSPTQLHHRRPWYDSLLRPCSSVAVGSSKWWHCFSCGVSHGHHREPWWFCGWRKLRVWSSVVVAGPMWKEFIRRFKGDRNSYVENHYGKFHYDPLDYAKNFDDGPGQNGYFDEDSVGRDFSARFASARISSAEPLFT